MTPFGDNVTYVYLNGSTWSQAWRDQLSLLLPHDLLHEMLFAFHRQAIISPPSSECVWQSCIRRKVSRQRLIEFFKALVLGRLKPAIAYPAIPCFPCPFVVQSKRRVERFLRSRNRLIVP